MIETHQETIPGLMRATIYQVALLDTDGLIAYCQSDTQVDLERGACVRVAYGKREVFGYVLTSATATPDDCPVRRLVGHQPEASLPPTVLDLMVWGAAYYRCDLPAFISGTVPAAVRSAVSQAQQVQVEAVTDPPSVLTARQRTIHARLVAAGALPLAQAVRAARTSAGTIRTLAGLGAVHLVTRPRSSDVALPATAERHALTAEQASAVAAIWDSGEAWRPSLLQGITGSGKTLVYMTLAERAIAAGAQVLILLPEIALTPQLAARFRARFGDRLAVIHSSLPDGERADAWRRVDRGEAQIILGPRSALFAPIRRLGLIVVDEEHEGSFKAESTPRYHARDLAIVYAQQLQVPIVLGSATPAMETLHHARSGRYRYLHLRERPAGASLPRVDVVDMRAVCRERGGMVYLSPQLLSAITGAVATQRQAVVLLNRRGWAPKVWCRSCGEGVLCSSCDVGLTYHRAGHRLVCHACGSERPMPPVCPFCGSDAFGATGIGTQMLEAAIRSAVPQARVVRLDADAARGRHAHAEILNRFARGEADVLVGTQMVAKGLDLPRITVVGVVGADHGLAVGDFRAAERTYQLVSQVAGRAGRGQHAGHVIVQAWDPDHPAIQAAVQHRGDLFWESERTLREQFGYPPYTALVRWVWSSPREDWLDRVVAEQVQHLQAAAAAQGAMLVGPTAPDPAFLQGRHRRHCLLKARTRRAAQDLLTAVAATVRSVRLVACIADVDPVHI